MKREPTCIWSEGSTPNIQCYIVIVGNATCIFMVNVTGVLSVGNLMTGHIRLTIHINKTRANSFRYFFFLKTKHLYESIYFCKYERKKTYRLNVLNPYLWIFGPSSSVISETKNTTGINNSKGNNHVVSCLTAVRTHYLGS